VAQYKKTVQLCNWSITLSSNLMRTS